MRAYASSPKPHYGASMKDYHSPSRTSPVQAPSPKPHHGASLKDFESPASTPVQAPSPRPNPCIKDVSPVTRTETPPYPTLAHDIDTLNKPLPSPPASIEAEEPQGETRQPENGDNMNHGDWKEEVCKKSCVVLVALTLCFCR